MTDSSQHTGRPIFFEIHSFHGSYWLCAGTVDQAQDAEARARRMVQDGVGQGVRVVRCTAHPDYDYVARTVLSVSPAGPDLPDPMAPLVFPEQDPAWCSTPADLRRDGARDTLAGLLARWLEGTRVTPLELLHSDIHATRLYDSGVALQGVIQKAAVAQVRNSEIPVQSRYRELMALADAVLDELRGEARKAAPPAFEVGEWGSWCRALAGAASGAEFRFQQFRALAAWLLPAKTWLAKLDRLGQLAEGDLAGPDVMPVDAVLAEILAFPSALTELAGPGSDRLDRISALIALDGGALPARSDGAAEGLAALARLLGDGQAPRTRAAIRLRLLGELASPAPLRGTTLAEQAKALGMVEDRRAKSASLAEDAELRLALERRALRGISPESVQESMTGLSRASDRLVHLVRLAGLMPFAGSRARILEFALGGFSVDDLIREGGGGWESRASAIPLLVETHRRVSAIRIEDAAISRILERIDGGLLDLVRTDVLNAPGRSYLDRILHLLSLCGSAPFPPGRARALVAETLARALGNAEFLKPYLDRFGTEAERRQALISVRDMLLAAGFGRNA